MTKPALQSKMTLVDQTYSPAADELLPWSWSVAVWVVLAGASWAALYFLLSVIL